MKKFPQPFIDCVPVFVNGGKNCMTFINLTFVSIENPIFSIDIHPDGSKFATGGQGNDAGQVSIWNLLPIIDENAEKSEAVPKQLCQLDNHSACVNCVRWSGSGTILASGGDDKIIMLWKRGKGPSAVFGNSGITKTAENWRCTTTLRGHSGEIIIHISINSTLKLIL